MDFERDAILMSHMGEGNWAMARADRPVRLIKRPLGIGGLEDPPTFLFQYATGPVTLASLVVLGDGRYRLVVARARSSTARSCRSSRCRTGSSGPTAACARAWTRWLRYGGPHHQVLNRGRVAGAWARFCEAAGIELVRV